MGELQPKTYAAIFDRFDDGVVVADTDRRIRYLNPAAERIFGYTAAEVAGEATAMLYASRDDFEDVGRQRLHEGSEAEHDKYRVYYRRKDGSVFASETATSMLHDPGSGALVGFMGIVRDITDRLEVEEQVAAAARTLQDAIEAIGDGFALFDADDRLVVCNEQYRQVYPKTAPMIRAGTSFRQLVVAALENGEIDIAGQPEEEWLEARLRTHREAAGHRLEQRLTDGRWVQIREHRTRDGGIAGVRSDITDLKRAQHELADALDDLEILTNSLPCLIAEIDAEGRCTFINELGASWLGSTRGRLLGRRLRDRFNTEEIAASRGYLKSALLGREQHFEMRMTFPDGILRDVSVDYIPKLDAEGEIAGIFVFVSDISDQKNVARTLRRLYDITSSRGYDSNRKIELILEVGCDHYNLPAGIVSRIEGDTYTVLYARSPENQIEPGTTFPLGQTYCVHTLNADRPFSIPHTAKSPINAHPCYAAFQLETYIGAPLLVDGVPFGTINFTSATPRPVPFSPADHEIIKQFADWIGHELARNRDLAQLKKVQAELERLASTDELTGILNRRELLRRAEDEFGRARRYGDAMSLLVLDLDHFKSINDQYGHATGDEVLKRMAAAVSAEVRPSDAFGRMGGEEFCVVVGRASIDRAYRVAERIRERVRASCVLDNGEREVTVSIGAATLQSSDTGVASIMERADRALYTAKEMGRNQTCVFPWEQQAKLTGSDGKIIR